MNLRTIKNDITFVKWMKVDQSTVQDASVSFQNVYRLIDSEAVGFAHCIL